MFIYSKAEVSFNYLCIEFSLFETLLSGFPAGTVSGAPKIRAMEIIDELEKNGTLKGRHLLYVKVDVEGSEMSVAKGMSGLLGRQAIELMSFEYANSLKKECGDCGLHHYRWEPPPPTSCKLEKNA